MNILVTGIAGFIGSHIAERLIQEGHTVFGVDNLSNGFKKNIPENAEAFFFDLSVKQNLDVLPSSIDIIIHMAGHASGERSYSKPVMDLEQNTVATLNLIEYGIKYKVARFLFASSISCYGHLTDGFASEESLGSPKTCYAVAKQSSENYLGIYGDQLPNVIFRIANVYGPRQNLANMQQGMVSIYLAQAMKNNKVEVKGSLDRFRDFVEVEDVVQAFVLAIDLENRIEGETFNLGSGIPTTVLDLLNILKQHYPKLEWYENGSTPGDIKGIYANIGKIRSLLGFNPVVSLDEGLSKFVKWAEDR